MKKLAILIWTLVFAAVLFVPFISFGQDSTAVDTTGGSTGGAFSFLDTAVKQILFYGGFLLIIVQVITNNIPSAKDWGPLTNIVKFISKLVALLGPNKGALPDSKIVLQSTVVPLKK